MPATHASGLACARAATTIEKTICKDPNLHEADAVLSDAYDQVLQKTAGSVKATLTSQQRMWLQQRNRSCVEGSAECLFASYKYRQAQLDALLSRSMVLGPDTLPDVTPLGLLGSWTAGNVIQLAGEPHHDSAEIAHAVRQFALPSVRQVITGQPGKICFDAKCANAGLGGSTLGQTESGARWLPELNLPSSTMVFSGAWGNRTGLTLIQRPDGSLLAEFGVCGPKESNCATAFQVWTPHDKAARIANLLEDQG